MGNYFGRKKEEGNDPTQDAFYGVEVKKSKTSTHTIQTVYRPHIFIDFYKSELFKVSLFSDLKICEYHPRKVTTLLLCGLLKEVHFDDR